jgi:hypothetical protein
MKFPSYGSQKQRREAEAPAVNGVRLIAVQYVLRLIFAFSANRMASDQPQVPHQILADACRPITLRGGNSTSALIDRNNNNATYFVIQILDTIHY